MGRMAATTVASQPAWDRAWGPSAIGSIRVLSSSISVQLGVFKCPDSVCHDATISECGLLR